MPDLTTRIGKLELDNPLMSASGTFGSGAEFEPFFDPGRLGAIVAKTVTPGPREGNPPPRTCETPSGLLNSIGLAGQGIESFLKNELPAMTRYGTRIVVNIAGDGPDEYQALAELLSSRQEVHGIELNVSCPNVSSGGEAFGADPGVAADVTSRVRRVFPRTLIVKLTPNAADISEVAGAVEWAGADAVTCSNTYRAMALNWRNRRSMLGMPTGGLSGPAVKPLTMLRVNQCFKSVNIPVIACGGACSAEDVLEYAVAGASAVQIGTANFFNYGVFGEVLEGLEELLDEAGVNRFEDLVGTME